MKTINASSERNAFFKNPESFMDREIDLSGFVLRTKDMGSFQFVHLKVQHLLIQVVTTSQEKLPTGTSLSISGTVKATNLKDKMMNPSTIEIQAKHLEIIGRPQGDPAFDLGKKELNIGNDVLFDYRMISLRHPKVGAIFRLQSEIVSAFREAFNEQGCLEIRSPKIVKEGAEGGANIFTLPYFGREAYLTQSPQFYKEFGVGAFERVFEIAPVFRAEKHNTSRHLNEYTSVDVEIGPIKSFEEVMELEVFALTNVMKRLKENCAYELELLEVELPDTKSIPSIEFYQAKEVLKEMPGLTEIEEHDLSPEEEKKLSDYMKEKTGSEFVFVTHYPTSKRPFYAFETPGRKEVTESFDLLFRGVEITTGGQRIHELHVLEEKMKHRGMNPKNFEFFSIAHKHGLPPHGGFGLGLERLTQKLIGLDNVKLATLFPRDTTRLAP